MSTHDSTKIQVGDLLGRIAEGKLQLPGSQRDKVADDSLETRTERVWFRCYGKPRDGMWRFAAGAWKRLEPLGWFGSGHNRHDYLEPPAGVAPVRNGRQHGVWVDVEVLTDHQALLVVAELHRARVVARWEDGKGLLVAKYWPAGSLAYRTHERGPFTPSSPVGAAAEVVRPHAEAIVIAEGHSSWIRRFEWSDGGERPPRLVMPVDAQKEDEDETFPEGAAVQRLHMARERNIALVRAAKAIALQRHGKLACAACAFDFGKVYGQLGAGFIEAHHIRPLSTLKGETEARVEDLALVCANCHRMLHRHRPWLSIEDLRRHLEKVAPTAIDQT